MPARVRIAVLVLGALLLLGAPAEAVPPRPVGQGTILTDGVRYAVFMPASGGARTLIDTRTGVERPIAPPPLVEFPGQALEWRLVDVGGGQLLWDQGHGAPALTDIRSGVTRPAPGWEVMIAQLPQAAFLSAHAEQIGDHWIRVSVGGLHLSMVANLNWRTGEWLGDPRDRTVWPNLSRPQLAEHICAPFRRRKSEFPTQWWEDIVYERPYVIFQGDVYVLHARCGSRRTVRLFEHWDRPCETCYSGEDGNSLSPRRPVWAGRRRLAPIRVYLPRRRRIVTLARMRRGDGPLEDKITIAQTRTRIFVQIRGNEVYWLPAPR